VKKLSLFATERVAINHDIAINVADVDPIFEGSDSNQEKSIVLTVHILGERSFNCLFLFKFCVPNFYEFVRRYSHEVLVIDPIQPENTAIVSILFLAQSLVRFSIIEDQLSVSPSTDNIGTFGTVSNVVDEASMRLIRFDEIVRRTLETF